MLNTWWLKGETQNWTFLSWFGPLFQVHFDEGRISEWTEVEKFRTFKNILSWNNQSCLASRYLNTDLILYSGSLNVYIELMQINFLVPENLSKKLFVCSWGNVGQSGLAFIS